GIRVFHVTGVQTCALPISSTSPAFDRSSDSAEGKLVFPHPHSSCAVSVVLPLLALSATMARTSLQNFRGFIIARLPFLRLQVERSEERRVGKECRCHWSWW